MGSALSIFDEGTSASMGEGANTYVQRGKEVQENFGALTGGRILSEMV